MLWFIRFLKIEPISWTPVFAAEKVLHRRVSGIFCS